MARFHGPRLHGDLLPGGRDWALFGPDGTMSLEIRLTLRTHHGALLQGRWVRSLRSFDGASWAPALD
ncbi:DUF3237 family protein [Streptomyces odontomachi]|uniref:DUF3237 family protein n=1 Tax=Streptomyces odontomachi TaxID=2944940 RepID=UPI0035A82425